ncbi:hypothetical protein TrLO_g2879 [Triparma laevis f. longispina]|uniref:Uncharacterized protein n=1 Tax=Triparma laevis f. longispina TaxID=1714387 RepID=A0A9W7F6F6_9STRA|nr:hypothetical protein TrLO_g2879 [Triparma laevis f. longispina]
MSSPPPFIPPLNPNSSISKYSVSQETSVAYGRKRRRVKTNINDWQTSIPSQRERVLLLGMSYPDITNQLMEQCNKSKNKMFNKEQSAGVEMVVDMVKKKILNEVDGRDLARILALEASDQYEAHCVSIQDGAQFLDDKYLFANFNKKDFVKRVQDKWIATHKTKSTEIKYSQIIMDYFWIPKGWAEQHWTDHLFKTNLPDFHQILKTSGSVYLPFKAHCFNELSRNLKTLSPLYDITFLKRWELGEVTLWRHTQDIDPETMEGVFRKNIDQEDLYCELDVKELNQSPAVLEAFSWIDDVENIRFIKLTPIEGRTSDDDDNKKKKQKKEKNPTVVKGGFVHMRGKNGRRNLEKRSEKEEEEIAIRCQPPPTFEMLSDDSMSTVTQMNRFRAWWMSASNEKSLAFFNRRSLREPHVRLVNAPRWCVELAREIDLPNCGPVQVISDPLFADAQPRAFREAFHPKALIRKKNSGVTGHQTKINGFLREGLLKYGLNGYKLTSRKTWNKDFPDLKNTPLWSILQMIEERVLQKNKKNPPDVEEIFEEIKEEKRLADERWESAEQRRETAKRLRAEKERNDTILRQQKKQAEADERKKPEEEQALAKEQQELYEETELYKASAKEKAESEAKLLVGFGSTEDTGSPTVNVSAPTTTTTTTTTSAPPTTAPAQPSSDDEQWDLTAVFEISTLGFRSVPKAVLEQPNVWQRRGVGVARTCDTENCEAQAVAVWKGSKTLEEWNTCGPCQENDFGGWPAYDPKSPGSPGVHKNDKEDKPKALVEKQIEEYGRARTPLPSAVAPTLPLPEIPVEKLKSIENAKVQPEEYQQWSQHRRNEWRASRAVGAAVAPAAAPPALPADLTPTGSVAVVPAAVPMDLEKTDPSNQQQQQQSMATNTNTNTNTNSSISGYSSSDSEKKDVVVHMEVEVEGNPKLDNGIITPASQENQSPPNTYAERSRKPKIARYRPVPNAAPIVEPKPNQLVPIVSTLSATSSDGGFEVHAMAMERNKIITPLSR